LSSAGPPATDVLAIAEKDLKPGGLLDGIGDWTAYGEIGTVENADGFRAPA